MKASNDANFSIFRYILTKSSSTFLYEKISKRLSAKDVMSTSNPRQYSRVRASSRGTGGRESTCSGYRTLTAGVMDNSGGNKPAATIPAG